MITWYGRTILDIRIILLNRFKHHLTVAVNSLWSKNLSSTIWMFLISDWISKNWHPFQLVNCLSDFFLKFLISDFGKKFWSYLIELILMLIIKRTLLRNSFSLLFILIVINPKSNGCVNKGISEIYSTHKVGSPHWGAPFRWSFRPISVWGSIETTTTRKTHPTLYHHQKWMKKVEFWEKSKKLIF